MNDNDSLWKKWQVRVTTIAGLLAIFAFLLTWSPKVREVVSELFGKKPVANVASGAGNPTGAPDPAGPSGGTPKQPNPPNEKDSLERSPLPKALPEQYINTAISRREGMKQAAILVRQESGESLSSLESAIATILAKRGVEPVPSFFKPPFLQEGRAKSLFAGDWTVSEKLQLGRHVDYVLIGLGRLTYSSNQQFQGLLTADLVLELKCLDVVSLRSCGTRSFDSQGAGYTQSSALQIALGNLAPKLESFVRETF